MRRLQRQLFALCFAPTVLMVLVTTAVLSHAPDATDLLLAVLATTASLVLSVLLYRRIDATIFEPVQTLVQDILQMQPSAPVSSQSPLLAQLVIALEQRMGELGSESQATTSDIIDAHANLDILSRTLPAKLTEINAERVREKGAFEAETDFRQLIASASTPLLSQIISSVNSLTSKQGFDDERLAHLANATSQLIFLMRELDTFDYQGQPESDMDVRQLVDETLALANHANIHVLPVFEETGNKLLIFNTGLLKALLFNYLIAHTDRKTSESSLLNVGFLPNGQLALELSPAHVSVLRHTRLNTLLAQSNARLVSGVVNVPATVEKDCGFLPFNLNAALVIDDPNTRVSLAARLKGMGVSLVQDECDAEICLTTCTEANEITALRDRLPNATLLMLLGNLSTLPLPNTVQLAFPILHSELAEHLRRVTDEKEQGRGRILVVDDNSSNLRLLTIQLSELGLGVETANSAAMARAIASRHDFALIIMDLHLPDGNGVDIAADIRSSRGRDIPVIIVSAQISNETSRKIIGNGIVEVMQKPASPVALSGVLASLGLVEATHTVQPRAAGKKDHSMLFDKQRALALASNRVDIASELLTELITCLPDDVERINTTFQARQRQALEEQVHRLHGAVGYSGLPRLLHATKNLESLAREASWEEIRLALNVFNNETESILAWFDPTADYFDNQAPQPSQNHRG